MSDSIKIILAGFISGWLSGQFGIGGGMITTPAIRVVLQYPAEIALGTPLLIIIPTSLTGAFNYYRAELINLKAVKIAVIPGIAGSLLASCLTAYIKAGFLMSVTAVLIIALGVDFLRKSEEKSGFNRKLPFGITAALIGLAGGLFSGLLGLGGGTILIPAFIYLLGFEAKEAFGTSLLLIALLSVSGAIAHYGLRHIDAGLGILMICGSIPGAFFGSRVTIALSEEKVRMLFGFFLMVIGVLFLVNS